MTSDTVPLWQTQHTGAMPWVAPPRNEALGSQHTFKERVANGLCLAQDLCLLMAAILLPQEQNMSNEQKHDTA